MVSMRPASFILAAGALTAPFAGTASASTVSITLPRLPVAEYKRPYVAGWIEPAAGGTARSLFVWYDVHKANDAGMKWLGDLRSWWRKAGRTMKMPADGISGATRAPGTYTLNLPSDLAPGHYVLNVEVARENGGRELVSVPVNVPNPSARASGKSELGAVTVAAK
jgi:hypothetical protein